MKKLLELKHWQLFGLLIGIPILVDIIGIESFFTSNNNILFLVVSSGLTLIVAGIFLSWYWAIGTTMVKKLPNTVKMNIKLFKLFLVVPLFYGLILSVFAIGPISSGHILNSELLNIIVPIHFFTMFCIFYCLYFNAKVLKSVEWQRKVNFSDYVGEFFLIWFFPIGIWFIQPRLNKLLQEKQHQN